jgi:GTP-binding protein
MSPALKRQRTDTKGRNFMIQANRIRNVAIVAHIDHGKTTLIDAIFKASHTFRDNARVEERVMDSNALERERGITIRAKHCTVQWEDYLINIIDTPGHADFSGEVERVLSMVDSVLLLVDACEGPMPQTRYVLMRALAMGYRPMVFINKVDRRGADPDLALDKTFDLFLELGATDAQADFPVLYGSALKGWASKETNPEDKESMEDLFQAIIAHVPPPEVKPEEPFLMQISTLAWNDYIGRIGCGKILQGSISLGEAFTKYQTAWINKAEKTWEPLQNRSERAVHLWTTLGLERTEVQEAHAGDIVWIAGPQEIGIGDTFASPALENPTLPPLDIEEPTVSMFFLVNNGPFAGQEGRAITLRQLRERLDREQKVNVGLRVEDLGRPDGLKVSGRGEMHLGILIEEMRREGLEFCVSPPEVITTRDNEGNLLEPIEQLIVDIPEEFQGAVIEKLARRKGELLSVHVGNTGTIRLEFSIPTRGLIGYRNDFLTDTKGLGIMSSRLLQYDLWRGEVSSRTRGSMVSMEAGEATAYQIENLQPRGVLFVSPMDRIYEGMVVGEHSRPGDIPCNPTKKKHLTNMRSANKDSTVVLNVPRRMGLEEALEWIAQDELIEITPESIRIRKSLLNAEERRKAAKRRGE